MISLQGSFATMKPLLSHGGIWRQLSFSANPTVIYNVLQVYTIAGCYHEG
jgi:hypothetical protein